ncbi:MAG: 2Fe-2S iron-sulfur cluster-binding protein [Bacteroidaceae bacterium]|nr:2Fe-2S iron-sulfur cluster-binding protein [Bacteroidaceae bacterium]
MNITINNKTVEVSGQKPLIEELRQMGYDIPSLCYDANANHQASCMVCMVRNVVNGQMIPSCSTFPTEGMQIEVDSEEVLSMRRMSIELLLSDHRADCEAPCTIVCPSKIDVAQVLLYYDRGQIDEAHSLLSSAVDAKNLPCKDCKGPCEKACRRGTVDRCVSIREIMEEVADAEVARPVSCHSSANLSKEVFSSKLGRYTAAEKEWLKEVYSQHSKCLHCACEGRDKCKLRECSTKAKIKAPRYGVSSNQIVKEQIHVKGSLYFEPAKCIRCGLCVYNSEDGFTFKHRGFDMQVMIPEESKENVDEKIADICPTGALFTV